MEIVNTVISMERSADVWLDCGSTLQGNTEIDGLSSTTYRRVPFLVPLPRKQNQQNSSGPTDQDISSQGTAISFRTFREAVGCVESRTAYDY